MQQDTIAQLIELLSLSRLLQAGMVIIFAWLLLRILHIGLQQLIQRWPRYRLQMGQMYPMLRIFIWLLATAYIIFGVIKPPQTIVFAVLGSLGLAVGLAAQGGVRNLLAGVMMIFNPPFRVGDMVHFGGYYGEVTQLDLSVTWLRTLDDNVIMVPNSAVLENAVANANSGELSEMVVINIDLPRTIDIQSTRLLAREVAMASPYSYLKKPVSVTVESRYEYDFLLRLIIKVYVVDIRLERLLSSDITERFIEALQKQDTKSVD
ncbi:MAG: mechanosensitive ion channel family protein [Gammaproteobacteria bacterium]|nr:mechanosensitive ion channel family protein [Gammaproteobacteria bacterium]MCW8986563.1 mechanosensitive ion channel family protein [Gammaproteobacteria bacterium]MCW9032332.1 mechanosensitive ion channel family protein [Gammaproteobacteria bacterium]